MMHRQVAAARISMPSKSLPDADIVNADEINDVLDVIDEAATTAAGALHTPDAKLNR